MWSPGCAATWPSMQAHTQVWKRKRSEKENTCMLPSLPSHLKAYGQNLKAFLLITEGNYSCTRNKFTVFPPQYHVTKTLPTALKVSSCPLLHYKSGKHYSAFPMQFGGTCLPDTHPPLCMQQRLPNNIAARLKWHGGNGWRGGFSNLHNFCDAV